MIDQNICISKVCDLSLKEFVDIKRYICAQEHSQPCPHCPPLFCAARLILQGHICSLPDVFRLSFPGVTYTAENAKRKLLQMPLVTLRLGQPSTGNSKTVVMEKFDQVNYQSLQGILEEAWLSNSRQSIAISRPEVAQLLKFAQSDRERDTIRYALYKASGLTPTAARRQLGLPENMNSKQKEVEECIEQCMRIHKEFDQIVSTRIKLTTNMYDSDSGELDSDMDTHTSSCSSEELDSDMDTYTSSKGAESLAENEITNLGIIIRRCDFNWFEFMEQINDNQQMADQFYTHHLRSFSEEELKQIKNSYEAYLADEHLDGDARERAALEMSGQVVTDSESDDPSAYMKSVCDEKLIAKKVAAIKRQVRRKRAKYISDQHFLGRKKSKRLNTIISKFPNIGQEIERYVESCCVGADAWRRTGVRTFDGNKKVGKKCTYKRIQQHLEEVYNHHFSYGTVVQLCVARNRHRLSAKGYKGLAQVTSRRARKGFQLKLNPDTHWSAALYRNLNVLQYTDATDILTMNRDDQAGFRLDTLSTHHQYTTPTVRGKDILSTHTDYVNRYPSVLQTTSYNFTGSSTTTELCAGVTKAQPIHSKNAAQHFSDINMLSKQEALRNAFFNVETGKPKLIDCVRVDGAGDEGPGHEEVQYYWTRWHLEQEKLVTLVTTRSSGSSFMNRVELQNGCLTRAHSSLFIPSTIHGSCIAESGKVDEDILHRNLDTAIDIYIDRCDGCSCGRTQIHLFKGTSSDQQEREKLRVSKGAKKRERKAPERRSQDVLSLQRYLDR